MRRRAVILQLIYEENLCFAKSEWGVALLYDHRVCTDDFLPLVHLDEVQVLLQGGANVFCFYGGLVRQVFDAYGPCVLLQDLQKENPNTRHPAQE